MQIGKANEDGLGRGSVRTKRFLKPRLQFKCTCSDHDVTTTNVDDMMKPFATPSVQRMLQMLKHFALALKLFMCMQNRSSQKR